MAAPTDQDFEKWLSEKLTRMSPDVDLEVFVTYITGILESETDPEERQESMVGLLTEIADDDAVTYCEEIVKRWEKTQDSQAKSQCEKASTFEDHIHSIVEKQQTQTVAAKTFSAEERARKAAILAQYAHMSDGEEDAEDTPQAAAAASSSVHELTVNVNAMTVTQRELETRERMKQDHQNKKQKDKEDQEKQKQKGVDRKESEKKRTQKGERRR